MNVDIFKDATSKLTSNIIPNMRFKAMSKQAVIGYMYRMHICSIFYACPSSVIQQS